MPNLFGTHSCTADEKGRVMMPVEFLTQLGSSAKKKFRIKEGIFHKALEMFTEESWKEYSKDTHEADSFTKKGLDFKIMFTNGVREIKLDSVNRFNIPIELFEYAGIKKDVIMTAIHDRIFIWDKKTYEKYISDMRPKMESVAEEVMGEVRRRKGNGK
ncbi:MAG: division/cell wall cluster transcriptional repressor MraZ [Bacteroidota bacterium]